LNGSDLDLFSRTWRAERKDEDGFVGEPFAVQPRVDPDTSWTLNMLKDLVLQWGVPECSCDLFRMRQALRLSFWWHVCGCREGRMYVVIREQLLDD